MFGSNIGYGVRMELRQSIEDKLNKCGLMYRIFDRSKTEDSIKHKLDVKGQSYYPNTTKKIQDVLGIRIVFYFASDVKLFCSILKNEDNYCDISDSEADAKENIEYCHTSHCEHYSQIQFSELFRPIRLNMIFRLDDELTEKLNIDLDPSYKDKIDNTYEVQLRSVLSEGWHEVEHDLRYKCRRDWKNYEDKSRALNGILASLETAEFAMESIFEKMAYENYRTKQWIPMLRNHLHLRMSETGVKAELLSLFNDKPQEAKRLLTCNRKKLITALYSISDMSYPRNTDNLIFLINRLSDNPSDEIKSFEPDVISRKLNQILNKVVSE